MNKLKDSPIYAQREIIVKQTARLARAGTLADIIAWTNAMPEKAMVTDIATLLGRPIRKSEAKYIREGSQATSQLCGPKFGKAHATAEILRDIRKNIRSACKQADLQRARINMGVVNASLVSFYKA